MNEQNQREGRNGLEAVEQQGRGSVPTQRTGPEADGPAPVERDPANPTATAPESVEHSVYEEAEFAGKQGPNAADEPSAAKKSHAETVERPSPDAGPDPQAEPGADLEPDEAADLMETQEEAHEIKQTREDQRDESLISLDPPD